MPSHTVASALALMYMEDEAPWSYPDWQKLTGIKHGLFPDEDAHLPRGLNRSDANFIKSYFTQYKQKLRAPEIEIIKFATASRANGAEIPGRAIWSQFVNECWKRWKIHARITEILNTEGYHPHQIALDTQKSSDSPSADLVWPNALMYVPLVVETVSLELFGVDILNEHGRIPTKLRQAIQYLIQRTWKVLHNQVNRGKKTLARLEEAALSAFDSIDADKPTADLVKNALIKLAKWKEHAQRLISVRSMSIIEEKEVTLTQLMSQLAGKPLNEGKDSNKSRKVNVRALRQLTKQRDVIDVLTLYEEFFTCPAPEDSVNLREQYSSLPFKFGTLIPNSDPGVEMEINMSPDDLASNLGFKKGLPLFFNQHRHRGGLSSWDPANNSLFEFSVAQRNADMIPITLHWHQLAGLHGILRMLFKQNVVDDPPSGVLVADEVGLGKTYQAGALVAFLSDVVLRQSFDKPLPPIITSLPYLNGKKTVPDLPHLIIVPGTLVDQWNIELQAILRGDIYTILLYGGGKGINKQFWAQDGPFDTSKKLGSKLIIIAAHSAVQRDFSSLFIWTKPMGDTLPWANPRTLPSFDKLAPSTLYGQKYLSVTVDEAHTFRNVGARHSSALLLLQQAAIRNIMTATPLQTSTKDVAGMGRLVGIPHFLSKNAFGKEKAHTNALRQKKDPAATNGGEAHVQLQMAIAHDMQKKFGGLVLRRTIDSKNWEGKPLINIPPYEEIRLIIQLTKREMDIICELADEIKDSVSTTNGIMAIVSRTFYIEHRMSVGFARRALTDPIPEFKTLEQWEARKSTKLDVVARLCRHLLKSDAAPEVFVEDGVVVFPETAPASQEVKTARSTKILIYQEFPSLGDLLRNVLNLYGIGHRYIDGQMSYAQRAKIVKEFCESDKCRVLILSSVGSVGLNLSVASVIIFLDQPWSAQDERQIRGRAHRQPQSKVVKCYHILADETADIVLAAMASGKKTMFNAFLEKDAGKEMYDLFSGENIVGINEDAYESDIEVKEANRQKTLTEKREAATKKKAERLARKAEKAERKAEEARVKEEKKAEKVKAREAREQNIKPGKARRKITSKETIDDSDSAPEDDPSSGQSKPHAEDPLPSCNGDTTDMDTTDADHPTDTNGADDVLTDHFTNDDGDKSMDTSPSASRAGSPDCGRDEDGDQLMSPHTLPAPNQTHSTETPQTASTPPSGVGARRRHGECTDSPKDDHNTKRARLSLVAYNSSPPYNFGSPNGMDEDSDEGMSARERKGNEEDIQHRARPPAQPLANALNQQPPGKDLRPALRPIWRRGETDPHPTPGTGQSPKNASEELGPDGRPVLGKGLQKPHAVIKPRPQDQYPRRSLEDQDPKLKDIVNSNRFTDNQPETGLGGLLPPADIITSKPEGKSKLKNGKRPLDGPLRMKPASQYASLSKRAPSSQGESSSEAQSSLQGQSPAPNIPHIRRPTSFGSMKQSLNPPAANLSAKNPFKGKVKRN